MNPHDFSWAFRDGEILHDRFGAITLKCFDHLGALVLPTGRLFACDPLCACPYEAFTVTVPRGRYPVILSVAHYEGSGDQRVAFAMVRFSRRTPVSWEMAHLRDQDVQELKVDEIFGYPVDSGTGCFMDPTVGRLLRRELAREEDPGKQLLDALQANYTPTWNWANLVLHPSTGANVIAFSSGVGDGHYASYFGFDFAGAPVCLVTDFCIIDLPPS